jgi:hypothetical protein
MLNPHRLFLQWLPTLPLLGFVAPPALAQPAPRKLLMNQFQVAGLAYYEVKAVIHALQPGAALRLVAEPTNRHDEFAVELWHGKHKLGYVPRSDNRPLSRLLQQGAMLTAEVWEADPDATVWERVRAKVYLLT